jgi:CheY-like chemotaxis protein/DNA-binding CsgD family transcriptional regulator
MILPVILVIDAASEYLQKYAGDFFTGELSCRMISATGLEMGIDVALQDPPDIILLAGSGTVEDGVAAIERIADEPGLKDVPVIYTSDEALAGEDLKKIFGAGASDYWHLPVDRAELVVRLKVHIRNANLIHLLKSQRLADQDMEGGILSCEKRVLGEVCDQMAEMVQLYLHERQSTIEKINRLRHEGRDEQEIVDSILHSLTQNNNILKQYEGGCRKYLVEDQFLKKLLTKHPVLHPADIKLCLLLRRNLPSKEIASLTYRSTNTVKVARSRLRGRLGLKQKDNLYKYLISI